MASLKPRLCIQGFQIMYGILFKGFLLSSHRLHILKVCIDSAIIAKGNFPSFIVHMTFHLYGQEYRAVLLKVDDPLHSEVKNLSNTIACAQNAQLNLILHKKYKKKCSRCDIKV